MSADVRWKQRFQNFDRAYRLLADALKDGPEALSTLAKVGTVRRFGRVLDLGWLTLRDYLEHGGVNVSPRTPSSVTKEGYTAKVLDDRQVWIDMLQYRNSLSHAHDETVYIGSIDKIAERFLPAVAILHRFFQKNSPAN